MAARLNIIEFLRILDNLKHLKRTGWVKCGIPEPETVASHMYRMAMLAWSLEGVVEGVDIQRYEDCLEECRGSNGTIVGDITPHCGVSEDDKYTKEKKAMTDISEMASIAGPEWKELWEEYETAATPEARVVKQLDKFDMIAQAFEYEQRYEVDLEQFFASTTRAFSSEPFLQWNNDLRARRAKWIEEGRKITGKAVP